jgi:hypothetical protein
MEQYIDDKWDQRNWELALATDKPVENYHKSVEERNQAMNAVNIDELTKEQQDWLRSI